MAAKEILLLGNPVLRTICEPVHHFSDAVVQTTIDDLRDTLADFKQTHGFGRGIAAPQIGMTQRIIFIDVDKPLALINPRITHRSRNTMMIWDDCFSFPDIVVKVERNESIHVEYRDESGTKQTLEAEGGLSELLQHEIDHLDGVLAIDRAIDSKHIILRSEWEKLVPGELTHQIS